MTLRWIGAIAILGMLILLVVFYLMRGQVKLESGYSGRRIVRFNAFERFVHWMTATCFIILAISGLNITFGKPLLMPLIGEPAFAAWSQWAKYAHNYLSFPFTIGVFLIFLMWIAGNIPNKVDVEWAKRGGGIVGHDHPPAYRFNGGQKMIYWIVVIGGIAVAITGYLLMFPFYATGMQGMQLAQTVHAIVAVLFVAAMLAHIYIGTIGMEGAFEAMGEGTVDVNWAKEHHAPVAGAGNGAHRPERDRSASRWRRLPNKIWSWGESNHEIFRAGLCGGNRHRGDCGLRAQRRAEGRRSRLFDDRRPAVSRATRVQAKRPAPRPGVFFFKRCGCVTPSRLRSRSAAADGR